MLHKEPVVPANIIFVSTVHAPHATATHAPKLTALSNTLDTLDTGGTQRKLSRHSGHWRDTVDTGGTQ